MSKNTITSPEEIQVFFDTAMEKKAQKETSDRRSNGNNSHLDNNIEPVKISNKLSHQPSNSKTNKTTSGDIKAPTASKNPFRRSFTESACSFGSAPCIPHNNSDHDSVLVSPKLRQHVSAPEPSSARKADSKPISNNAILIDRMTEVVETEELRNSPTVVQLPKFIEQKNIELTLQELEAIRTQDMMAQAEENYRKKSEEIFKRQSASKQAVTEFCLRKDSKATDETIQNNLKKYMLLCLRKAYIHAYSDLHSKVELEQQATEIATQTHALHATIEADRLTAMKIEVDRLKAVAIEADRLKAIEKQKSEQKIRAEQEKACCIIL